MDLMTFIRISGMILSIGYAVYALFSKPDKHREVCGWIVAAALWGVLLLQGVQ